MPQIIYAKQKIKLKSISPCVCAGSLGVMWLWKDFLKESISATNNLEFLCLVNLNYYVY